MQLSTVWDLVYLKVCANANKPRTIDTRKHGKPDLVKLTLKMVKEFDAEAVGIISNPAVTQKLVYGLTSRGIPAYGAIFDS
jgi:hypothetical protein